ncbi:MAG: mercuric reductase [Planctomycetota bacterium]|jgi:pyruvate/2-oxoglutarate dehydrogenase complex dihydrolipoamide dehydrogenase (E3) component
METPSISPMDEHNRRLVSNVRPPDWRNPEPKGRYDLVVIGAGTAGLVTAAGAATLGADVALVERDLLGGDCLNVGCVPSKALIRSARAAADVRDAAGFGVRAGPPEVDFAAVMERVRRLRADISPHDSAERLRGLGVDVFLGSAAFLSRDTIGVEGVELRFARAVIATGARAAQPPIPGLAGAGVLTNETVFNLTERPARLAVLGAGPLGCELAQAFARLGSEVTMVQRSPHAMTREDPDAVAIVEAAFAREGIRLLTNSVVSRLSVSGGTNTVHIERGIEELSVEADEVLLGLGRAPNVSGLGLENAGVSYDEREGIRVDDHLRTTNRRIWAAGDCCMRDKFTHAADAAARIVIRNALFGGRRRLSALTIPWCTYTDPEVAHVGVPHSEIAGDGVAVDTFERKLADVDRAVCDGEAEGFVKIRVKKGTDRIVGATIVARHAGEMIGEVALAMAAGVGLGAISEVVHPYPTQAEAIRHCADAYNRTRLTPFVRRTLDLVRAIRR